VPIRPVIQGHPDPAYDLASVVIEPDVATVLGPQELTAGLEYIATVPIDVEGLTRDANMVVLPALVDLDPSLKVSPDELRVFVNLDERMAEKTFDLPIALQGAPGFKASAFVIEPKTATVSVTWPAASRLGLEAAALEVLVRVDSKRLAEKGGRMELPVLVNPPVGVKVTAIDPVNVTVRQSSPNM
jgi:YbbR domain-containing protein